MTYFLLTAIWLNSQSVGYWPPDEPDHPIGMKCGTRWETHKMKEGCDE